MRNPNGPNEEAYWAGLKPEPEYECRFIPDSDASEIVNLYHLARVPLSGTPDYNSKLARMQWAAKAYAREHPNVSVTGAYKDLDGLLR